MFDDILMRKLNGSSKVMVHTKRIYVLSSRPASRSYTLQTTFPVKELTNENQTLKEAGLLNAVVVQRYT